MLGPPESNYTATSNSSNSLSLKKKQCGLLLKNNVTIWNVLSIYVLSYLVSLGAMMGINFFTILIQDHKYYVIS